MIFLKSYYLWLSAITILLNFSILFSDQTRRAVIDIGSQGTKITVADVDTKNHTINDIVLSASHMVGYKNDLVKQKNPTCFSPEIIKEGINAINDLKNQAEKLIPAPEEYFAFATAGLRSVACAEELIKKIEHETGITTRLISQEEEGRLAFEGSVATAQVSKNDAIVWEIGGGSMQITTLDSKNSDAKNTILVYGNNYGIIPFRTTLLTQVLYKNPQLTQSLNPLSYADAYKALQLAELLAQALPQELKEKITKNKNSILATGVINRVARLATNLVAPDTVSLRQLEDTLYTRFLNKTDKEIADAENTPADQAGYLPTTGLILTIGFMKALGITTLKLVKGGIRQGVLVDPNYYTNS